MRWIKMAAQNELYLHRYMGEEYLVTDLPKGPNIVVGQVVEKLEGRGHRTSKDIAKYNWCGAQYYARFTPVPEDIAELVLTDFWRKQRKIEELEWRSAMRGSNPTEEALLHIAFTTGK